MAQVVPVEHDDLMHFCGRIAQSCGYRMGL
jgi:hypothetical protein